MREGLLRLCSVLWGTYPGVESLAHRESLCLTLEPPPGCSPRWLRRFTFPPAVREGSDLSTSS